MGLHAQINSELERIEQEKGVCIVYACESGSRAWGFESSDSDYDVRFIYLHMAQGNYRDYLQGDTVWLKEYLYVLRPVLACLWIERGYGVVPIEFHKLAERVIDDADVKAAVQDLIRRKKSGEELDRGPHIPEISSFLKQELDRLSQLPAPQTERTSSADLDGVFRECLIETHGNCIRA